MHHALGIKDIGHLYYLPVTYENSIFLVTVRFLDQHQQVQVYNIEKTTIERLNFSGANAKMAHLRQITAQENGITRCRRANQRNRQYSEFL